MNSDILRVSTLIKEYYISNCSDAYRYNEIEVYATNNDVMPLCNYLLNLSNDIPLNCRYHGVILLSKHSNINDMKYFFFLLIQLKEYCICYYLGNQTVFSVLNKLMESVIKVYLNNKDHYNLLNLVVNIIVNHVQMEDLMNLLSSPIEDNSLEFINSSIIYDKLALLMIKILLEELEDTDYEQALLIVTKNNILSIIEYNINLLIVTVNDDYSNITDLLFDIITKFLNFNSFLFPFLIKLMTVDEVNFKYTDPIINIFYTILDDNGKLDYNSRYLLERYFNPTTILPNHDNIDVSFVDDTFVVKYIQHLIDNKDIEELSKLSLFYSVLLDKSNKLMLNKIFLNEDVSMNLTFLLSIMDIPLVPVEEEQFSLNLLSFWNDLVDNLIINNNKQYNETLYKLMMIYFKKMTLQNYSNNVEFLSFRDDAIELIKNIWSLVGNEILYDLLNDVLSLNIELDCFSFENYINITNNLLNFDEKVNLLLAANNYNIINKVIESMKMICSSDNNLSILMLKTLTSFLSNLHEFLNANVEILNDIINTLLDLIFNHRVGLQIERTLLMLLSQLVKKCGSNLHSFRSTFELILSNTLKSENIYTDNLIVTMNYLYGCLLSSFQVSELFNDSLNGDHYLELRCQMLDNANNYLSIVASPLNNNNNKLILKCMKGFFEGLCNQDKGELELNFDNINGSLMANNYLEKSLNISKSLLTLLNESFLLNQETNPEIVKAWFDMIIFIINNSIFHFELNNVLQLLSNKLYKSNLIENGRIYIHVILTFESLVKKGRINTLRDFKMTYNTLIINSLYNKNNLVNIIRKDIDLLESYYNLLTLTLTDHWCVLIPSNSDYDLDDDISAFVIIQSVKDYQKYNEKFILLSITKYLVKLFNNKKYNTYQSKIINDIFISDGNYLSYSNIIKISFIKVLNTNGDFDFIVELVRNIINKHRLHYKKWFDLMISDGAFVEQCLMFNKDINFINKINIMLIKKIQVCNGSRKIISVVNDWYKELSH
ncbi:hypothetical protein ACO0R3_003231 [Hanseniaspora guilliermondii]